MEIWAKYLKTFTISGQKWRPTLFDLKKWCTMFSESYEDLFFEGHLKRSSA